MPVRLMIVDDHESVRELLRAIVEDSPEDVVVSGEAAESMTVLGARGDRLRRPVGGAPGLTNFGWVGKRGSRPRGSFRRGSWIGGRKGTPRQDSMSDPVVVGLYPTQAGFDAAAGVRAAVDVLRPPTTEPAARG